MSRFTRETLAFIDRASRQKRPDWLDRHRDEYEKHLLGPLLDLAKGLKTRLAPVAPGYHFPQRGLGRLKRSAPRAEEYGSFFKDWVSYGAARPRVSRFDHNPNLYFLLQPGEEDGDEVLVAGGLYMPSSRQLRSIREAIAQDGAPFDKLFATPSFAACFPGGFSDERISTRVPRGFDPHHPRLDWLKLQAYFVWKPYTKRQFYAPGFVDQLAKDWREILRLNELLDLAIEGKWSRSEKREPRAPRGLLTRLEDVQAPQRKMDF